MKLYSVKPMRSVIVDTSIGLFKVYADGSMTMWKGPVGVLPCTFVWFDETDLDPNDLEKIVELGKKSMPIL